MKITPICLTDSSGQVQVVGASPGTTQAQPRYCALVDSNGFVLNAAGSPTSTQVSTFKFATPVNSSGLAINPAGGTTLFSNFRLFCVVDDTGTVLLPNGGNTKVTPNQYFCLVDTGGTAIAAGAAAVYKLVARSDVSFNESNSVAGREVIESRVFMKVQQDCTVLRFYMSNIFVSAAGVETAATSPADWSCALENSAGTLTVVAPQGVVTLAAGAGRTLIGEIPSSAFSLSKFTKGEVYYWRPRYVTPAAGKQLQFTPNGTANSSAEISYRGPTTQSQIAGTGPMSATGVFVFSQIPLPFEVLGLSSTHGKQWGGIGDSIMWGQGDNAGAASGDGGPSGSDGRTTQGGGFVRRAMYALDLPYVNFARQATTALSYTTSSTIRRSAYADCDRWLIEFPTNDLANAATAVQVKGYLETIAADIKAVNPNALCYLTTTIPRGATNAYATPFSGESERLAHNVNVRSGNIVGYTDYADVAAAVEGTAGFWAVDADNVDGTHPSSTGHAKMATALQAKLSTWSA